MKDTVLNSYLFRNNIPSPQWGHFNDTERHYKMFEFFSILINRIFTGSTVFDLCIIFAVTFIAAYLFLIAPRIPRRKETAPFCNRCYAHRGLFDHEKGIPENSLPAFAAAVQSGYGIELDVQITKDGKIVVFHDSTLSRMCKTDARVRSKTYQELSELELLETGNRIPLLTEVLELVDGKVPLLIEIKLKVASTRTCILLNEALMNYEGPYCIESFNILAVRWYKRNRPDIIRGQLSANLTSSPSKGKFFQYFLVKHLLTNFLTRPDFISYRYQDAGNLSFLLNKYLFRAATMAWTVNSEEACARCIGRFDSLIFEGFRA